MLKDYNFLAKDEFDSFVRILLETSQSISLWSIDEKEYERVRFTEIDAHCDECNANHAEYHALGCSKEQCPKCNLAIDLCDCVSEHKKAMVKFGWQSGDIDLEIAALLYQLWNAGIDTICSCQSNPDDDWIWIQIGGLDSISSFFDIVVVYEKDIDTLYNRIICEWTLSDGREIDYWDYDFGVMDLSLESRNSYNNDNDNTEEVALDFSLSIRFPKYDHPAILKKFAKHNKTKQQSQLE